MPVPKKSLHKRISKWQIQSSKKITASDSDIISPSFSTDSWHQASIPSSVLGTLVENGIYKDPFYGKNLEKIEHEAFQSPWWYRSEFNLSQKESAKYASLDFDGINYRADIWFNSHKIGDQKTIYGAFRRFSFDISSLIQPGKNILAVKVIPPVPGDFSIGFVDWNPAPPDGNMGLFRPVTLRLYNEIAIQNPFVQTQVNLKTLSEADLTISAELVNYSPDPVAGILQGKIESLKFSQGVQLAPNSRQKVFFTPEKFSDLNIKNPRLWWPVNLGKPDLYVLELQFQTDQDISDTVHTRFGIRQVEDYWLNEIHRGYKINGRNVLIKGAGWTDDLFLMDTAENIETQVKYVKHLNLNCIRLEGIWGKDHRLYDLCDEYGILLMVGWSCHWEHEIHMGVPVHARFGGVYKSEHIEHISKAWQDQVIWLRNHPSIFVWTVASDKVPITELEQRYIDTFAEYDPTRPYLNSTGGVGSDQHVIGPENVISDISGSSGVKMLGPYEYTAPVYWFTDTKFGGAYGFNTETCPGAQPPVMESLKRMIPTEQLWPMSEVWDYHCGRYEFADLRRFTHALNTRYGKPENIEDFDRKAQAMNYELMRPMFEAFQINKSRATGVVQWMLNAAWPKMYWQLYDYYLNPTAAFYATKKACQPLNLIYNYGNNQVYFVNDLLQSYDNLHARIRVYDIESRLLLDELETINATPDSCQSVLKIPQLKKLTPTYFLDLRLLDAGQKEISNNFYWLSTKEELLDYEADLGDFAYHTPSKEYADLTLLNLLPKVDLEIEYQFEQSANGKKATVNINNPGAKIAFQIYLKIVEKRSGEVILPVFWEENYISLLPGEKRTISVTFNASNQTVDLKTRCWNFKE